uniref:Uncharacterized protein n=1 Tax=Ixodes ricinus TaxID=34613 RepID=A0A6B0UAH4_IXORI
MLPWCAACALGPATGGRRAGILKESRPACPHHLPRSPGCAAGCGGGGPLPCAAPGPWLDACPPAAWHFAWPSCVPRASWPRQRRVCTGCSRAGCWG